MALKHFSKFVAGFLIAAALALGIAALVVFNGFDSNAFRKAAKDYLTELTGLRTEISDVSLVWADRPKLKVIGIKFYDPQTVRKIFSARQIEAEVDLSSIWKKRFVISKILVQGATAFIYRDSEGVWCWEKLSFNSMPVKGSQAPRQIAWNFDFVPNVYAADPNAVSGSLQSITQDWKFNIDEVEFRASEINFSDEFQTTGLKLQIQKINATIRAVDKLVFDFWLKADVFEANARDLVLQGRWNASLSKLEIGTDFRNGRAKANVKVQLADILDRTQTECLFHLNQLDLESTLRPIFKDEARLAGTIAGDGRVSFKGVTEEAIRHSALGSANLEIKKGAILNRNFVREALFRLSDILPVQEIYKGDLPEDVLKLLSGQDTAFDLLKARLDVGQAVLMIREFELENESYRLVSDADLRLVGDFVDGTAEIFFSKNISNYLAGKIKELSFLTQNTNEEILIIPFSFRGALPDVNVQPDLVAIGTAIMRGKAQEALSGNLAVVSNVVKQLIGQVDSETDKVVLKTSSKQTLPQISQDLMQKGMDLLQKYQSGSDSARSQAIQEGMAILSEYKN